MKRSALVELATVALAAVSCGGDGGDHPPVKAAPVDVPELLARAGHSRNDWNVSGGLAEHGLLCKDDVWLPEVYWPPLGPPRLERIVFVAWDMPAGTLRGWDLVRNAADRHTWSAALSAEEVGFGCDERNETGFFLLAGWPDNNISPAVGFERIPQLVVLEDIGSYDAVLANYFTWINIDKANVPAPDTSTYYLKNLFTGATFTTDVPVEGDPPVGDDASPNYGTRLEVDYGELGLGAMTDVASCVVYKREGVAVTNHCFTVTTEPLPRP